MLYKTNEIVEALKLSGEQAMNCQVVLGDTVSDSITSISFLAMIDNQSDLDEIFKVFIEGNERMGMKLVGEYKQQIKSGEMQIFKFNFEEGSIINIFTCLNNQIYISNTNCLNENWDKAERFAKEVMSTISLVEE